MNMFKNACKLRIGPSPGFHLGVSMGTIHQLWIDELRKAVLYDSELSALTPMCESDSLLITQTPYTEIRSLRQKEDSSFTMYRPLKGSRPGRP